uniref:RNA exonuclease 4 n=1 Tax=Leersia perrieri TaxID=77586 RepID=A0A0D9UVV4_9ORYZ
MDSSSDAHRSRNRCAACYREFNKKEHLVEHMRTSLHSPHDPRCGACGKHCRSLDALRDHLTGAIPKPACAAAFAARGCPRCLHLLPSQSPHSCPNSPPLAGGTIAVALGCKMVGAGSDGSLDVCARVCLVDEYERVVFEAFVKPSIPVTHYRYETTGIRPEHLRDGAAVTAKQAARRVLDHLLNGEAAWKARSFRGRARILVGHGLDHDLESLGIDYPDYLKRDTARYPPLMKTSNSRLSNSLKYLTAAYLGYQIQPTAGGGRHHHPYDDCVAALRLYRRMRGAGQQQHHRSRRDDEAGPNAPAAVAAEAFPAWRQKELERMSPEELLQMSTSDYYCWCLDNNAAAAMD